MKEQAILSDEKLAQYFLKIRLSLIDYASTHPLDDLLTMSLDSVGDLVQSPIGFYHFVGPDQKTLILQQWSSRTLKEFCRAEGKGIHYNVDQAGVWVDCLYQRRAVIHNDYPSLPHRKGMPEGHVAVVRELVVPVFRNSKVVAILGVGNKPTDYTQRDVDIVTYFADVTWEIVNQKRTEESLKKTTYDLRERVKELSCLYSISKLIEEDDLTIDEILQGIVDLIPQSWQYPEITCARITLSDQSFRSSQFIESKLFQSQKIRVNKKHIGCIEVFLTPQSNKNDEPFLAEEQYLLNTIAERIGHVIERKMALDLLKKSHDELQARVEERTKELAAQNFLLLEEIEKRKMVEDDLKISSEKIKIFAYSVAHDLKNPAISINGLVKLIDKKIGTTLDDKGKKICRQILRSSEDIVSLVQQINTYISTKETPLHIEPIDLKQLLKDIRSEFSSEFNRRSVQFSVSGDIPDRLIADRISVKRIFRNIIENSLKYGGNELGCISIDYKESDTFHIFTIADDGKGLEEPNPEYIFDWFKRRAASNEPLGTGMGLAIIKEIIELHGGEICYEPGKAKGVSFSFSLNRHLKQTA